MLNKQNLKKCGRKDPGVHFLSGPQTKGEPVNREKWGVVRQGKYPDLHLDGFDLKLVQAVTSAVNILVIARCGAGMGS